jgi:uncharacterized protein YndB with AHSA1/START domain
VTVLPHRLDRTIVIGAPQAAVFKYFTDASRWAAWWGAGSTIEPRPGGRVYVRYPTGDEAAGEVVEIDPPTRIVFTYGFLRGTPVPPGGSRVTIRLEPAPRGTRLHLVHEFAEAAVRDEHVQGWRYQLSLFANVVSSEVHGDVNTLVDAWFAMWSDHSETSRAATLASRATSEVRMRDRFSCVDGTDELTAHIAAAQRFMPGLRLQREGNARHCQGTVLADWLAVGPDSQPRGRGTNVFTLNPEGKIESVTGFWS